LVVLLNKRHGTIDFQLMNQKENSMQESAIL